MFDMFVFLTGRDLATDAPDAARATPNSFELAADSDSDDVAVGAVQRPAPTHIVETVQQVLDMRCRFSSTQ